MKRAHEVLFNLENSEYDEVGAPKIGRSEDAPSSTGPQQMGLFAPLPSPLIKKLKEIRPDELTPREALTKWYEVLEILKDG